MRACRAWTSGQAKTRLVSYPFISLRGMNSKHTSKARCKSAGSSSLRYSIIHSSLSITRDKVPGEGIMIGLDPSPDCKTTGFFFVDRARAAGKLLPLYSSVVGIDGPSAYIGSRHTLHDQEVRQYVPVSSSQHRVREMMSMRCCRFCSRNSRRMFFFFLGFCAF